MLDQIEKDYIEWRKTNPSPLGISAWRAAHSKYGDTAPDERVEALTAKIALLNGMIDGLLVKEERVAKLVEAAKEVLRIEAERNEKNIRIIDGVKTYPIGGDMEKNRAFYTLDSCIRAFEASKGGGT